MSKIAALRDLVVALLREHERDGTIPTNGPTGIAKGRAPVGDGLAR
jgi:hypothetical protein